MPGWKMTGERLELQRISADSSQSTFGGSEALVQGDALPLDANIPWACMANLGAAWSACITKYTKRQG